MATEGDIDAAAGISESLDTSIRILSARKAASGLREGALASGHSTEWLLQRIRHIALEIGSPNKSAFPEFVDEISTESSRDIGNRFKSLVAPLAELLVLLVEIAPEDLLRGAEAVEAPTPSGELRPTVIEEVTPEEADKLSRLESARQCSTALARCVATLLPHAPLPSPWVAPGAAIHVQKLAKLWPKDDPVGWAPEALLDLCIPEWRPVLLAGGGRLDERRPETFEDNACPPEFDRALASRQMASLVLSMSCDTLGEALPKLIPFLVASLCDVLPAVKAHGLAATHHVALTALPSVLLPFAPLLRHHVARIARGAPRRLWPLAAAATVSLAVSESRGDPRHESLEEAAWFLMDEAERHSHDPERRLVAAWALPPLCASAGLISLRFLSRALPLALEWAAAADLPSVCGGLAVVATVVRVGWPRVRRRGAAVWASLLRAADALATLHGVPRTASTEWRSAEAQAYGAARPVYQSDAEELERAWDGIVAVGALLWLTGDAKAREALEAGVREGGARGAVSRLSVEAGIELERGAP